MLAPWIPRAWTQLYNTDCTSARYASVNNTKNPLSRSYGLFSLRANHGKHFMQTIHNIFYCCRSAIAAALLYISFAKFSRTLHEQSDKQILRTIFAPCKSRSAIAVALLHIIFAKFSRILHEDPVNQVILLNNLPAPCKTRYAAY